MEELLNIFHVDQPFSLVWIETYLIEEHEDINLSFSHIQKRLKKESHDNAFMYDVAKDFYYGQVRESKEVLMPLEKQVRSQSGSSFFQNLKRALLRKHKERPEESGMFYNSVIDRSIFFEKSQISKTVLSVLDGIHDTPKLTNIYSNSSRYFFKGLLFYDFCQNPIPYFKYDLFTKSLSINEFSFKPTGVNASIAILKTHKPDILTSVKIWTFLGKDAARNNLPSTVTVDWITKTVRIGSCEISFDDDYGEKRTHFVYLIAAPRRVFTSIFRRVFRSYSIES